MAQIETPPEGFSVIPGRGKEQAQKALQAADEAGVSQYEVKTRPDGYLVPDAVADKYHELFDEENAAAAAESNAEESAEPAPESGQETQAIDVVEGEAAEPAEEEVKPPAGNASQDAWAEYAATQPGYEAADADLSRDELRAKYGPQK
jgi:hypothetical protein